MSALKLIEVAKRTSGQEAQSIYDHTDLTEAVAAMHYDFGTNVKDDTVVSVYCFVIDNETGSKIDGCYWEEESISTGEETEDIDTVIRDRVYTHNDYSDDNIAPYDTERLAIGNYHTKRANAMKKAECNHAVTILIDRQGDFIEFSNWERPIEETP